MSGVELTRTRPPTPAELSIVAGVLQMIERRFRSLEYAIRGLGPTSPWLLLDVRRAEPHDAEEPHEWQFGIWRETGELFAIDEDGAVQDEPLPLALADVVGAGRR